MRDVGLLGYRPTISTGSEHSVGWMVAKMNTNATWPAANLAIYVPFRLQERMIVVKMFVPTEAGGTDDFDVGIFTAEGTKLVSSGATAQSAFNRNEVDVTDTLLDPGRYYFGLAMDGTTAATRGFNASNAGLLGAIGLLQEAGAMPLPANMTPAVYAQTRLPLISASMRTSPP